MSLELAKQSIEERRLGQAIRHLSNQLRDDPTNTSARRLLLDCLCVASDFERAKVHLTVLESQSPASPSAAQFLRDLIEAEECRVSVLTGRALPNFLTEPPVWVQRQLAAVRESSLGSYEAAATLFDEAERCRSPIPGTVDGEHFTDVCDLDDRLSSVLEFAVMNRYFWIPLDQLRRLETEPPRHLRDMRWLPARIEVTSGQSFGGVVFPLYWRAPMAVDTGGWEADEFLLGGSSSWESDAAGARVGKGLRVWSFGSRRIPLSACRTFIGTTKPATRAEMPN